MTFRTRAALLALPTLCPSLRWRLERCGAPGVWGWAFCRSPSCDRCRRHRLAAWASEVTNVFEECGPGELYRLSFRLDPALDVAQLRGDLTRARRAMRNLAARARSKDGRADDIRMLGAFTFDWIDGASLWLPTLHLLVDLVGLPQQKLRDRLERRWRGRFTMSAVSVDVLGAIQAEAARWLDFSGQSRWPPNRLLELHEGMHHARGFSMSRFHLRPFQEWTGVDGVEGDDDDAMPVLVGWSDYNPFRGVA